MATYRVNLQPSSAKVRVLIVSLAIFSGLYLVSGPVRAAGSGPAQKNTVQLASQLDARNSSTDESTFGDVTADALLEATHADIALVPADEIDDSGHFDPGTHLIDDITNVLRYSVDETDTVTLLTLTGSEIELAIERSVSRAPQPFDGFLQVGGIRVHYDTGNAPGHRARIVMADGAAIDVNHPYTVATSSQLANGSFGYFRVWKKDVQRENLSMSLHQALQAYLSAHSALNPIVVDRIIKE